MDDALRELVSGWLAKASVDQKAAERLEPAGGEEDYDPAFYDAAAFHLQQAAEKTIKAYLARHSVSFKKTHHLDQLLSRAAGVDAGFGSLDDAAEALAPFAVEIRYPGDWSELTAEEYLEAKHAATGIITFVMQRLDE